MEDTVNLFINSKNALKSGSVVLVNLPNSYIQCKRNEAWSVSVVSFQSMISWKNIQFDYNDSFSIDDEVMRLDVGNPTVYELEDELKTKLNEKIDVLYISRLNKWLFKSNTGNIVTLRCVNCSQFLGFQNDEDILVTTDGVYSDFPINLTSDQLIFMRIDGDIGLNQSGLANIETDQFYPNDILFSFIVNQAPNSLINYEAPYDSRWRSIINTQSDTIDQFTLRLTNEEGRTLPTFNDFFIHLRFEKMKNDSNIYQEKIIRLLMRITNYLQEIYLIITQYLNIN